MSEPKISVHILAKETTELGARLFESCVESILDADYAHEIIVIDNGCDIDLGGEVKLGRVRKLMKGFPHTWDYDARDKTDFAELRNMALHATSPECTHFHWIDTDECYPKETLSKLKETAKNDNISAITTWFWHFMIDPTMWQEQQNKTNFYKLVPGIKWELPVHEHLVGYDKTKVAALNASYHHYGYIRPQWVQALKWIKYDVWQKGNANHYREYFDGGHDKVVDYYSDGRTPDECLEDRRPYCSKYIGAHTDGFEKNIIEPWIDSGKTWNEWLKTINDCTIWDEWQEKRKELGSWKDTIGWACERYGLKENE